MGRPSQIQDPPTPTNGTSLRKGYTPSPGCRRSDATPQPRSEYLREILAEKKAQRLRDRDVGHANTTHNTPRSHKKALEPDESSLCSSISATASSSGAQDDWIFDSDKEVEGRRNGQVSRQKGSAATRTPRAISRQRRSSMVKDDSQNAIIAASRSTSKDPASTGRSTTTAGAERALGHRETHSIVDRLTKENFDLKLRITLQEERMARMNSELDDALALAHDADKLRRERDKLCAETAESLEMNDQLVRELEQRDAAVEEAAGIIQELEEQLEDLRRHVNEGQLLQREGSKGLEQSGTNNTSNNAPLIPPPRRGSDSRPSTAMHDSDYFSAESSPTRSLPVQHSLRQLGSHICLHGRPSSASLASEFSVATQSNPSSGSASGKNTGDAVTPSDGKNQSAFGATAAATSILASTLAKSGKSVASSSNGTFAARSTRTDNNISKAPLPQPSRNGEDEIMARLVVSASGAAPTMPTITGRLGRSQSVRSADSRRNTLSDVQRQKQLSQSPQNYYALQQQRFHQYQQKKLYHNVNQIANTLHGSPDACPGLGRQESNASVAMSGPKIPSRQASQRHQQRMSDRTSRTSTSLSQNGQDRSQALMVNLAAQPDSIILASRPPTQAQSHHQSFHVPARSGFDVYPAPGSSRSSKSSKSGSSSSNRGEANIASPSSYDKSASRFSTWVEESGRERNGVMENRRRNSTSASTDERGDRHGSPYASFLSAASSLKALTNGTVGSRMKLGRTGTGTGMGVGVRAGVGSEDGKEREKGKMAMGMRMNTQQRRPFRPRANTIDAGNGVGSGAVAAGFFTPPGLRREDVPSAPSTNNIRNVNKFTPKTIISTTSDNSATMKENDRSNIITSDHNDTNHYDKTLPPTPSSFTSATTYSIQHPHANANANAQTRSSTQSVKKKATPSNPERHLHSPPPRQSTHSHPSPHTLSHTFNQTTRNRTRNRTRSLSRSPSRSRSRSRSRSASASPTPTTASDPTESSFNVSAWGGPPAYKALPWDSRWVGTAAGAMAARTGRS